MMKISFFAGKFLNFEFKVFIFFCGCRKRVACLDWFNLIVHLFIVCMYIHIEFHWKFIEMTRDIHSTPTIRKNVYVNVYIFFFFGNEEVRYAWSIFVLFSSCQRKNKNKYTSRSVNWVWIFIFFFWFVQKVPFISGNCSAALSWYQYASVS